MTDREQYTPGPASGAQVRKDGEKWTLILVRELRHSPEKVWQALTDPAHLREWAPFEADGSLGTVGTTVKLTTVGAPTPQVTETTVTRADAPKVLEYNWGDNDIRWELEAFGGGTRLTLWHNIDRRFISMGAAGWHICFDVLDRLLSGTPIGRIVGGEAMKFGGWQRLNAEYAKQFGIEAPKWSPNAPSVGTWPRLLQFSRSFGSPLASKRLAVDKAVHNTRGETNMSKDGKEPIGFDNAAVLGSGQYADEQDVNNGAGANISRRAAVGRLAFFGAVMSALSGKLLARSRRSGQLQQFGHRHAAAKSVCAKIE